MPAVLARGYLPGFALKSGPTTENGKNMIFIRLAAFLLGALIVFFTLLSAIRTFVLPRSYQATSE